VRESLAAWRRRSGWLAAAGLFLAANVLFFFWYRGSGEKRQEALEARRASLASEVTNVEREAGRLADQNKRLSQVSRAIDEFYGRRVGSQRETQAAVVDEIHSILKRAGVAPSQIAYTISPVAKLPLSQMTAAFSFAADYRKFKHLLDLFETGPRWIVVREISLAQNGDVPGAIQARTVVATYFSEDRNGPPEIRSERGVSSTSSVRKP
jgi:hypothetical protein